MPTMILNVSNRLPVTVSDDGIKQSSGGLVAALAGVSTEQYALKWIGWPGGEIDPASHRQIERTLERDFGSTPVFVNSDDAHGHYEGFSNSTVWPILHYLPSKLRFEPQWWEQYQRVNHQFADKVISLARDGDIVWVHDYQLMLVPAMLREAMPTLKIGFFLHTPFPSYEVFRCIPHRDELVAGLLGADLVGFHTFGYMRHFRSSVLRLLGIESELTRIRHDGRTTTIGVYPIGINARKFAEQIAKREHQEKVDEFTSTFGGKRIVLSVERLDYTKGILHRLDAIDMFLSVYAERDHIKFIFVSVPSRENVAEYQALREEVEARVGRINGRYTTLASSPIHFIHGSIDFAELAALYSLADVGLVTPLIDGMNLVAKEYVAAQCEDDPGVLVLSEFAGAAQELLGALTVNPYDAKAVADAVLIALDLPIERRRDAMRAMRQRVHAFDAQAWARAFIGDLQALEASPARNGNGSDIHELRERLGATIRRADAKVAMFLDYDGTLREIERDPAAARPNDAVRSLLDRLSKQRNVDVTIISGRTAPDLESFLGQYPFGLVAEHGASFRRPHTREWTDLDHTTSFGWKDEIVKVLRLYETSTPGSFIEDKRTSVVWHYRQSDAEFGSSKAKQLVEELGALTASEPIQVRHGHQMVEIVATGIDKAAALSHILNGKSYDLILCAGDDATDESMFRLEVRNLLTIRVGEGETRAQYRVRSPEALRRLLRDALPT